MSLTSPYRFLLCDSRCPGLREPRPVGGRKLISGSHKYVPDHTRTWRASPHDRSVQCRGHFRDSTNMKDITHQAHTQPSQQGEYGLMITTAKCDTLGPWGLKVSWHLSYRWGKTPKKPHPVNLSRPGIEPGPDAWQARMLPFAPQRWTRITFIIQIVNSNLRSEWKCLLVNDFFFNSLLRIKPLCRLPVHRCGSGGNMRACHAAGPGSTPVGTSFLGEVCSGFFLTCKTNVRKL